MAALSFLMCEMWSCVEVSSRAKALASPSKRPSKKQATQLSIKRWFQPKRPHAREHSHGQTPALHLGAHLSWASAPPPARPAHRSDQPLPAHAGKAHSLLSLRRSRCKLCQLSLKNGIGAASKTPGTPRRISGVRGKP